MQLLMIRIKLAAMRSTDSFFGLVSLCDGPSRQIATTRANQGHGAWHAIVAENGRPRMLYFRNIVCETIVTHCLSVMEEVQNCMAKSSSGRVVLRPVENGGAGRPNVVALVG